MKNVERTAAILKEFHQMGIKVNIDDFGTGYSSLAYLKHFPIHTLKIDKSFVHNCTTSPSEAAIIRAIVTMAQALNIKVTVEGVETPEQMNLLTTLGCDYLQGYLISKPVSSEQIGIWVKNYGKEEQRSLFL